MAQQRVEEMFGVTADELQKQARKLSEPGSLRRMANIFRETATDSWVATIAAVFDACADRIERRTVHDRLAVAGHMSGSVKERMEVLAKEIGIEAKDLWGMDFQAFVALREAARKP